MKKIIFKILILIIIIALIVVGFNIFKEKTIKNNEEKVARIRESDSYFKIKNITNDKNVGTYVTDEIFIDFESKKLFLIEINLSEENSETYAIREFNISDEDMNVYKEIENYKESSDIDLIAPFPGGRWEIGYKNDYRVVAELPNKTEMIEKIIKYENPNKVVRQEKKETLTKKK